MATFSTVFNRGEHWFDETGPVLPTTTGEIKTSSGEFPGSRPDSGSDSVRGVIAERVHRIEALLGSPTRDPSPPKNLWFYKVKKINLITLLMLFFTLVDNCVYWVICICIFVYLYQYLFRYILCLYLYIWPSGHWVCDICVWTRAEVLSSALCALLMYTV